MRTRGGPQPVNPHSHAECTGRENAWTHLGRAVWTSGDTPFRGYTFLLLWNHPLVGAALCLGLFLVNPWAGAAALLGNAVATAVAVYVLGVKPELTRYGLFGGNGMFVGLALGVYLPSTPALLGLVVPLAALASLLTLTLFRGLSLRLQLPVLVLPFLIVGWLAAPLIRGLPIAPAFSIVDHLPLWAALESGARGFLPAPFVGFFRGLSEMLSQDSVLLGVSIFASWLPRARVPAFAALAGFIVSWAALPSLGGPLPGSDLGVWAGTNGALAALCLGGIFLRPTISALLYALLGAVGATWLTVLIFPVFVRLGLPIFAAPFIVVALLLLFVSHLSGRWVNARKSGLAPVPLAEVSVPEDFFKERVGASLRGREIFRWRRLHGMIRQVCNICLPKVF